MILPLLGLVVLLWMFLTYKARMRTRNCRWREDHSRDTPEGRYFICMTCGVETFRPDYLPPPVCLGAEKDPPA
jgi:hypothetical protein